MLEVFGYQVHQTPAGADMHLIPADGATIDTAGLAWRVTEGLPRIGIADAVAETNVVADLEHHSQCGKLRRVGPLTAKP